MVFVARLLLVILALAALKPSVVAASQRELPEELGSRNLISFIFGLTSLKEENLHPKVHAAPSVRLGYRHIWFRKNLQEMSAEALYCRPKTGLEDLNSSALLMADIAYGNGFPVHGSGRTAVLAGPTVRLHYSLCYYPDWDDSHLYWGNFLALGSRVHVVRRTRENRRWVVTADLPLIALFTRPDMNRLYKFDDISLGGVVKSLHEDMQLGWWGNVLYLELSAGYQFSMTPRIQHTVSYSLNYSRVRDSEGDPLQILTHNIGLEVGW